MFEWDETKRLATIEKHGIDFLDAIEILERPHLLVAATSTTEFRFRAIGLLGGKFVCLICTIRNDHVRIITARVARRHERQQYQNLHP